MAQELRGQASQNPAAAERLELEGRRLLRVTGVKEVLHVEDRAVVLRCADTLLAVRGEGLRLKQLTPQEGRVELQGQIWELRYAPGDAHGSVKKRIFG